MKSPFAASTIALAVLLLAGCASYRPVAPAFHAAITQP
jgi:polysaccharide biosynthesis/export protein